MMFGAPWLALGLLAALGPALLVLWILRMRRARLRVPAQWLWDESREDLRAQVPFQRLRWSVLLLLQAIALALLLLAAAQPRVATSDGRGGRTVLLVDASASMQTRDGMQGGTRFDDAIEAARAAVDRLHPAGLLGNTGGQTMLVTLEGEARIVQPFTGSRTLLHRALDDLRATDASALFEQAAMLSSAWAAVPDPDAAPDSPPPPPARLELFTDGGLADLATVAAGLDNLRVHSTGTAGTSNSAVARVGGQRSHDDSARIEP